MLNYLIRHRTLDVSTSLPPFTLLRNHSVRLCLSPLDLALTHSLTSVQALIRTNSKAMSDTTASSTSPLSNDNSTTQKMSNVLGVIVIARNGDRQHYYQDPNTYAGAATQTTALGEVNTPHFLVMFISLTTNFPT